MSSDNKGCTSFYQVFLDNLATSLVDNRVHLAKNLCLDHDVTGVHGSHQTNWVPQESFSATLFHHGDNLTRQ